MITKAKFFSLICILFLSSHITAEEIKDSLQLDEIVVTGTRNATDIRHLPMIVSTIQRETITSQHHSNILSSVMQMVPSLFVTERSIMGYGVASGGSGAINLRGLTGATGQLAVLINGQPQYSGIFGHPIADSYQTQITERVEVLRGPASVLYGSNAMGGVINIVTRSMKENGIKTGININGGSYGTLQTEISNQFRKDKFNSTITVSYGRTDNHRKRMGFEQIAGLANIGVQISKTWSLSTDINISHFNASHPGSISQPLYSADQWITRGLTSLAIKNTYTNTSGAINIYSNFGRHKLDDGTTDINKPTEKFFKSKDALTGVSIYQSFVFLTDSRLTLGFDHQHIYGNAYYISKNTGEVLPSNDKQSARSIRRETAGYIDLRHNITDNTTIDVGLRYDYHTITGSEWIPQIGLVIRPTHEAEIKAMVSKGFRNPTMKEMYLYPPSNEELKPEKIWNYEISWKHRLKYFSYTTNIFYIDGDNMIQTVERKNINTGKIKNYGIEADASIKLSSSWNINANLSYLHMKYPVIAAPKYKTFFGVRYNHKQFNASANMQYISKLYTSVGTKETLETFCLVDASVGYKIKTSIEIWVKAKNLLNQEYEINLGYPMPGTSFMTGVLISL